MTVVRRDANARLIPLAVAGLLAGVGAAWIVGKASPDRPVVPVAPLAVSLAVLIGWSFIGSGLLSWRPRPGNLLGPVLVFTGFAWFASTLPDSHNPVLFTIGAAVYPLFYVGIVYLVISFPSGRLHGTLDRGLVVVTIGLTTVVQVASLFSPTRGGSSAVPARRTCWKWPVRTRSPGGCCISSGSAFSCWPVMRTCITRLQNLPAASRNIRADGQKHYGAS